MSWKPVGKYTEDLEFDNMRTWPEVRGVYVPLEISLHDSNGVKLSEIFEGGVVPAVGDAVEFYCYDVAESNGFTTWSFRYRVKK